MSLMRRAARLLLGPDPRSQAAPSQPEPAPVPAEPTPSPAEELLRLRADALEKRADLLEEAARRADLRAEAAERRVDQLEGESRVGAGRLAHVEATVAEVDGFRLARARQIDGQQRLTERFVASVASLLQGHDALQQEVALLRRQHDRSAGGMPDARLDRLYLEFENRLRGSREEIKGKQAPYLDLVREAGAGTPERPILDIGAGRGEWLELLRDHGLHARGIDLNPAMVENCRAHALDCTESDALSTLEALRDGALGMITGFHIIEHLPFATFVGLLDQGLRVLAPNGVLLFETPDPANLIVGSHTFYNDPTHRNPLPSLMVRTMAEARGFDRVEIRRLNPSPSRFTGIDTDLIAQLETLFFGPQDYALIARRAA